MNLTFGILSFALLALPADVVALRDRRSSGVSTDARMRILQKNEARILKKPAMKGKNGSGTGGRSGGKGDKTGGGLKRGTPKNNLTGRQFGRKKKDNGRHSGHLDSNTNGITPESIEYTYGEPVSVSIQVINDMVPLRVLKGMDLENINDYTMGVFMRMEKPRGNDPIVTVKPDITNPTGTAGRYLEGGLRGNNTISRPNPNSQDPEEPEEPEQFASGSEALRPIPTLDLSGSAAFTATDVDTLDPKKFGNGFDIYLLDENGEAIIGPGTVYFKKTDDMVEEEAAATKKLPNHALAKFNHAAKKRAKGYGTGGARGSGGRGVGRIGAKGMGLGSGSDGGAVIGTAAGLASYDLETDKEHYELGENVTVKYDVGQGDRRKLASRGNKSGGRFGGSNNNTTTTQTTISATSTSTSTTTPDFSGPDVDSGDMANMIIAPPVSVDETDITLFSLAVYPRMANPQGGKLNPLYHIPFDSSKTKEELESGEFTFNLIDDLSLGDGGGFDVWILNGISVGIAGPYTFYVEYTNA